MSLGRSTGRPYPFGIEQGRKEKGAPCHQRQVGESGERQELQQLADDLLKKLDPDFADAANELLNELGVKPEDIDPIILASKSSTK